MFSSPVDCPGTIFLKCFLFTDYNDILSPMKRIPVIFFALFVFGLTPVLSYAQAELGRGRQSMKTTSEARGIAFSNTVLPVLTGLGSVWLFEGNTVRKVGSALAMYGLTVGPSTGNFHAEDYVRGSLGIITRVGAGLVLKNTTREIFGSDVADAMGWDNKEVSLSDTDVLIAGGVFVGSMVYNIISAKASVERYNSQNGYSIQMNPNIQDGRFMPTVSARINF